MKAIVVRAFGGPEVLELSDVDAPRVAPGKVLVRHRAIGVNFADTLFRQGKYGKPELPAIPGYESAGVIEEVGAGVEHLRPGMRVACVGARSYSDVSAVDAAAVIPLPDGLTFEEGAAFPTQVLTAWHLVHTHHATRAGDTVLVHAAAGGVGTAAVQIAKAAGAHVVGTVSSEAKAALVRELGADEVIDYTKSDFQIELMKITSNRGADLILDAVGAPTFEKGISCLAPMGEIVLYGRSGGAPAPLEVGKLFARSVKVSCFVLRPDHIGPVRWKQGIDACFELIERKALRLVIGAKLPLERAAEAHRLLESRESVGKIVLLP